MIESNTPVNSHGSVDGEGGGKETPGAMPVDADRG